MSGPSCLGFRVKAITIALSRRSICDSPADLASPAVFESLDVVRIANVVKPAFAQNSTVVSTAKVGGSVDRIKVVGTHTCTHVAQVIQIKADRRLASMFDEKCPVSDPGSMDWKARLSIAIGVKRSLPDPAPILVCGITRKIVDTSTRCSSRVLFSPPVFLAHPNLEPTGDAFLISNRTQRIHGHTIHHSGGQPW